MYLKTLISIMLKQPRRLDCSDKNLSRLLVLLPFNLKASEQLLVPILGSIKEKTPPGSSPSGVFTNLT